MVAGVIVVVIEISVFSFKSGLLCRTLGPKTFLDPKYFWTQNFFGSKFLSEVFWPKVVLDQIFLLEPKYFWTQNVFGSKFCLDPSFFDLNLWAQKCFWTQQFYFAPKIFIQHFFTLESKFLKFISQIDKSKPCLSSKQGSNQGHIILCLPWAWHSSAPVCFSNLDGIWDSNFENMQNSYKIKD